MKSTPLSAAFVKGILNSCCALSNSVVASSYLIIIQIILP